jgi:shikimate 5-dehydrogenase
VTDITRSGIAPSTELVTYENKASVTDLQSLVSYVGDGAGTGPGADRSIVSLTVTWVKLSNGAGGASNAIAGSDAHAPRLLTVADRWNDTIESASQLHFDAGTTEGEGPMICTGGIQVKVIKVSTVLCPRGSGESGAAPAGA